MRSWRWWRNVLALPVILMAILWFSVGLHPRLLGTRIDPATATETVKENYKLPSNALVLIGVPPGAFTIKYPDRVRMDHDTTITLSFGRGVVESSVLRTAAQEYEATHLITDVKVTLNAPSFTIQDSMATQEKKKGASLPVQFQWTVSPQKAGTFNVVMDVTGLVTNSRWSVADSLARIPATLNSAAKPLSVKLNGTACCQIAVPIVVDSEWGLSPAAQRWISLLAGIISAVLGLSFVNDIINEVRKRSAQPLADPKP